MAIGTSIISRMLIDFIQGKCKYKSLGKEQGDVDKWDDFILKDILGGLTHYQIKENNTNFCDKSITRARITRGDRTGQPADLSDFDKTIHALLVWYKKNPSPQVRKTKHFVLCVPYHAIFIKENLSLIALMRLCNEQIRPTTDVAGLQQLAAADPQIASIYTWLTEWCEFVSWEEVLGVFSHLKVQAWNSTAEIHTNTDDHLAHYFATPTNVRQILENTIVNDANFTSLLPAKYLLEKVRRDLLPQVNPWSKYRLSQHTLYISGIQDHNNEYESPEAIVEGLWDCTKPRLLYMDIPMDSNNLSVYQSLIRVCLHLPRGHRVFAPQSQAVITHLLEEVGQTIGLQAIESEQFPIYDQARIDQSAVEREISAAKDLQIEAEQLSQEMSQQTWTRVISKVIESIRRLALPLQTELERRWNLLRQALEQNPDRRQALFRSMMHPRAERQTIRADLRVGPQTAALLAQAIFYQLVVLTALEASDDDFEEINGRKIQTLALMTWSGSMDTTIKRVRKLSEHAHQLMGKQPCDILVMPYVDSPTSYLVPTDLASTAPSDQSLAVGRQISLVITGSSDFEQWIEDGDIAAIQEHFKVIKLPIS